MLRSLKVEPEKVDVEYEGMEFASEDPDPEGPFGAKEIGEGSTLPVMGALANAIHDATGVRITELPITSEKILKGLKALRTEGGSD